ncbi:MAG TPA: SGNH/GDSL hydrolase family protein [Myxococcales bacterium]|nr:SGNH/GDSL hydrolase family protein [Myxococcales bacterium]
MAETARLTYLALGDSTGVGVGAADDGGYVERLYRRLLSLRPGASLVNLCQSGATSADVRDDQMPRARRVAASLVTLGIGINDVTWQMQEEAFAVNLEEIAVALAALRAPVVIMNIPDLALAPVALRFDASLYERRIEVFNEHVEATAARHRFTHVDLFGASKRLRGRSSLFSSDGFHPSAQGYEEWAAQLWPAVHAILATPATARP